ncbi:hypothetical protein WG915_08910 [Corynebacterium sp. H128]|uniref:hypothetical protein n=1 Tax=Corynebacterium sp. H128 TaxID=3133427 RepID=UPI00309F9A83
MAGIGAPPKLNSIRRKGQGFRVFHGKPGAQPSLESDFGELNPVTLTRWHPSTLRFWDELGDLEVTRDLMDAQWSLLARAVMLDDAVLAGRVSLASEARLQLRKFGIAPSDALRLRQGG